MQLNQVVLIKHWKCFRGISGLEKLGFTKMRHLQINEKSTNKDAYTYSIKPHSETFTDYHLTLIITKQNEDQRH